jgi:hypothetical protein
MKTRKLASLEWRWVEMDMIGSQLHFAKGRGRGLVHSFCISVLG